MGWRVRVLGVVVVLSVLACSRPGDDQASTGTAADVLAFVSGSGAKVAAATSYRYSFENLDASDFTTFCGATLKWDGAIDTTNRLAFLNIRATSPTVILSSDTMFVKASALPAWRIPGSWLSVPFSNADDLRNVGSSLGVNLGPRFWASQDTSNPTVALAALRDTVSGVDQQGNEQVRGVDTTRYDLTIDPAKAGLWTGGTTTIAPAPTSPASPEQLRAGRQALLDNLMSSPSGPAATMPDDVKDALLDGDVEPFVGYMEHTTGTSMKPEDRTVLLAMFAADADEMIRSLEASTGTTMDPAARTMIERLGNIGTIAPDVARSRRQVLLDSIARATPGGPPIPDDVQAAVLDGDVDALVAYVERTTGTSVPPIARSVYEMQMSAQDMAGAVGSFLTAFTSIRASIWVDHDGVLRRLDERIDTGAGPGDQPTTASTGQPAPPIADIRLEFWDVGVPIADTLPDPSDVTPVADLSRTRDIPTELSPCDTRFPNTTR